MNIKEVGSRVTAVIVTYQSAGTLAQTISAVRSCNSAQLLDCILVDNGSIDGTPEILLRQSDWATVILTGENNGFGRGSNIGLKKVKSEYTLFLNPDAHIEGNALQGMISFLDNNPHVGIVGPATLCGDVEGTQDYQGTGTLPTPWTIVRAAAPLLPPPNSHYRTIEPGTPPFRTEWVCGAVLMIRTELAKRLQGFDPRFFLYFEEMDLCRRADEMGLETWALGTVLARHIGGASSVNNDKRILGCLGKHYYQSRRYYMIKHFGWVPATASEIVETFLLGLHTLSDMLRGQGFSRIQPRLEAPLLSLPDKV